MPPLALSPVLLWFLAGIVFFILELFLPGLIVFFFGLGAWCTALATYLLPLAFSAQLLIFLGASLVTLLLLRSVLKKVFLGRTREKDAMEGPFPAGATGEVIEDILPPAAGKIRYGGSFWRAVADTAIPRGTVVRIVDKTNLTVKVAPMAGEGER